MTERPSLRRTIAFSVTAVILLVAAICHLAAAPVLTPQRDETVLNGVPVVVEYATSVTAEDLVLPYYPGADIEDGFTYTVTTKDGKPVCYYARAALTTPDPPERVAAAYRRQLPGEPEPEVITDDEGERRILAVGTSQEVRQVTIAAAGSGSRIQLIRATKPAPPAKPIRPRSRQEKVI